MNTLPAIISGLGQIADRYDAVLCDVWGVIHNGHEPFQASVAALARFRKERGPVILITNSPRPSREIPAQFDQIGVSHNCYDAIVTSGDATRSALQSRAPGPVYILGPKRDLPLYDGLGLQMVSLQEAAFISCTGLVHDMEETPDDYRELLAQATQLSLPMVCANPDIEVLIGNRRIWCGGALAAKYAELGGTVYYAGKPHAPIYALAFERLQELTGKPVDPAKVLAIGDGIGTDITGAMNAGIDSLFVATGIHTNALDEAGALNAKQLAKDMAQQKTRTRYGASGLVW
ncbi:HAD superfamily protein involved in N-acetyl-glucosamine catabolism [hydrothermal vent metagenome]|uniref:HAD superfamily protein involved in N-acetyl-glucosamine catabolism n=1 Tax=hydrothermal vent metagenome TaxID=652676 RepID=A0A3B0SNA0_9ZZZZ